MSVGSHKNPKSRLRRPKNDNIIPAVRGDKPLSYIEYNIVICCFYKIYYERLRK